MPVHPAIAALRGNPSLQHAAQARVESTLAEWRAKFGLAALERELGEFAEGAKPGEGLAALFGADEVHAWAVVGGLVRAVSAALAEQPLGHLSLGHALDDSAATLVLARSRAAALSLQVLGGVALAERPLATSAVFQPAQSVARVLRGSGQARLVRTGVTEGPLEVAPLVLETGLVLHCDGQREAMLIDKVDRPLLLLKLQRRSIAAVPARELDIVSGVQMRQAASSPRDSRLELATTLLGRMGRADAVPMLAAIALEPGSSQLRWHALRECLALDSGAGFATLSTIADQPADPLTTPALALRAQLRSTHPELKGYHAPCD